MDKVKEVSKKSFLLFSSYISPALFAVIVVAIVTGILLFVSPINGLADNGTFFRPLNSNSLYITDPDHYSYLDFFTKDFSIMQYYNQTTTHYVSTQQLFVSLAVLLNKIFYSTTVFDIRFLGFVFYLFYLGAIFILVRGLTFGVGKARGYLIALLVIFILGDSSYTIYFNSFYTEAVGFISSMYLFGFAVYFYRAGSGKSKWLLSILMILSAFLFIGASRQEYMLIFGILIMGVGLFSFANNGNRKLLLSTALLTMLGFTIWAGIYIPSDVYNRDVYNSLTRGVMLETETPGKRLNEGGVNLQYGLAKGTSYYDQFSPISPTSQQVEENLINKTGFIWIFLNYVNHPDELSKILNVAVQDIYLVKPNELGNYLAADTDEPAKQTVFFMGYNRIKAAVFPKTFSFFLLFSIVLLGIYAVGFYNGIKMKNPRMIFRFFFVLGSIFIFFTVFLTAVVIDGDSDLVRHLFLVPVFLDYLLVLLLSDVIGKRVWVDTGQRMEEKNEKE